MLKPGDALPADLRPKVGESSHRPEECARREGHSPKRNKLAAAARKHQRGEKAKEESTKVVLQQEEKLRKSRERNQKLAEDGPDPKGNQHFCNLTQTWTQNKSKTGDWICKWTHRSATMKPGNSRKWHGDQTGSNKEKQKFERPRAKRWPTAKDRRRSWQLEKQ